MAAASLPAGAYMGRYLVAVDADIDPTDMDSVLWAIGTRSDPQSDVDLIKGAWGGPLDPALGNERHGLNSRLLLDACKPWNATGNAFRVSEHDEAAQARARELLQRFAGTQFK